MKERGDNKNNIRENGRDWERWNPKGKIGVDRGRKGRRLNGKEKVNWAVIAIKTRQLRGQWSPADHWLLLLRHRHGLLTAE